MKPYTIQDDTRFFQVTGTTFMHRTGAFSIRYSSPFRLVLSRGWLCSGIDELIRATVNEYCPKERWAQEITLPRDEQEAELPKSFCPGEFLALLDTNYRKLVESNDARKQKQLDKVAILESLLPLSPVDRYAHFEAVLSFIGNSNAPTILELEAIPTAMLQAAIDSLKHDAQHFYNVDFWL